MKHKIIEIVADNIFNLFTYLTSLLHERNATDTRYMYEQIEKKLLNKMVIFVSNKYCTHCTGCMESICRNFKK